MRSLLIDSTGTVENSARGKICFVVPLCFLFFQREMITQNIALNLTALLRQLIRKTSSISRVISSYRRLTIVLCWALVGLEPCKGKNLSSLILHYCSEMSYFRVLASGSLPGNMTFRRNNEGLESLGFFPCMAKGETNAQQCAFPVKPRYLSYLF